MFIHVGSAVVGIYLLSYTAMCNNLSINALSACELFVFLQDRPWSRQFVDYVFRKAINFIVNKVFEKIELSLRNLLNQVFIYNFYY